MVNRYRILFDLAEYFNLMDYKKALIGKQKPVSNPDSAQKQVSNPDSVQKPVSNPDSVQKPVSNPDSAPKQNTALEGLLCQLQEKYPRKSPQELEKEFEESKRLHSEMDELNKRIKAMKEEIQRLEQSSLELRHAGNALSLRAHLEKGYNQAKLSTAVHDLLYGFWGPPDYEQSIALYEQMLIHYPQNRDQACFYLALIYLKGKIDNQNRGKEHRRQVLSDPKKAEFYAQMIEDPKLLERFQQKAKKYLAKRK
jgi:hypothetical protein